MTFWPSTHCFSIGLHPKLHLHYPHLQLNSPRRTIIHKKTFTCESCSHEERTHFEYESSSRSFHAKHRYVPRLTSAFAIMRRKGRQLQDHLPHDEQGFKLSVKLLRTHCTGNSKSWEFCSEQAVWPKQLSIIHSNSLRSETWETLSPLWHTMQQRRV